MPVAYNVVTTWMYWNCNGEMTAFSAPLADINLLEGDQLLLRCNRENLLRLAAGTHHHPGAGGA
jgi:hypothetical protein